VYALLENHTGIRMWMTPARAAAVLALTALMCLLSGLLAGRRAMRADPAELF
jgi:putative ABC transport system permease protein